ncbi:ABC transporter permease [Streptomyces sp. NBC_00996]|uniref:ABC transporter permease n=1 Tax=Streptomyces sp. NBC_00996 TaxID=2903710 RepID=UPI0038669C37|nr:ABC transporter permease [Streptomyces sp. NBC_00996]
MSGTTTGTVEQAAPTGVEPPARGQGSRTAAVLALARFEARELLLQIPVFVFFALYVGYTGWTMFNGREGMDDYPVLQDVDRSTQTGPLLLGIALFVCVDRAVLRSRRQGTDRHFDVLVMEPWRRTVAHALSVVPFAAGTALVVVFQFTWAALKPGAVGHGSPAELAVGPLAILLSGTLGVLLARLIRSTFGAPLFVVVAYVVTVLVTNAAGSAQWARRLSPAVSEEGADPIPSELLGRPAAWHVLYLVGLMVLLLCLAVLVGGGRTRAVKALTAVALAATVTGVAGQSPGDSAGLIAARAKASVTPEKVQSCVGHGRSTYCAYPEWTGRTADWAEVVARVQSLAGGSARGERLTVRQRVDARYGLESDAALEPSSTPGVVTVGTRWGGNRIQEFAVGVASVLVAGDEESSGEGCDARAVTIMWLALASEPDPMTVFRHIRLNDSVKGSGISLAPTNPVYLSAEQTRIVRELLHKPRYSVIPKVRAHWAELTSAKTSTARVAQLLGVPTAGAGAGDAKSCEQ